MTYDRVKILSNKKIGKDKIGRSIYKMQLQSPKIAKEARPGQFITIKCEDGATFLWRPFSIAYTEKGRFLYIIYKAVGKGTEWLSKVERGIEISILGALGKNPFIIYPEIKNPVLVAGGIGTAPLIFLCKEMLISTTSNPLFLIGADTKSAIITPRIKSSRAKVMTSTQDGSLGYHGNIIDILDEKLSGKNEIVYATGPPLMLKETYHICQKHGVPCQVLLESIIACGIGACYGCTVETTMNGYKRHQRICSDGPVFDASIINWSRYIEMHMMVL